MSKVRSEDTPAYFRADRDDDEVIQKALAILAGRLRVPGACLGSPGDTRAHLTLRLATLQAEAFVVIFLDNQNRVIETRTMFTGTIDMCSVHPREIARAALQLNAAAVILAHNHPSGGLEPSAADRSLTDRIVEVLKLFDIRVLDHVIVAGMNTMSFAERGLI